MSQGLEIDSPQCHFYVMRKKRLCRMTVRPGRSFCGEHEPKPMNIDGKPDIRVPCPLDPKHTCYKSKLNKHLKICNARQTEVPHYIVKDVNVVKQDNVPLRFPLSQIPKEYLELILCKINKIYEKHLGDGVAYLPDKPIHSSVLQEINEENRTETSRRHLRQVSRLLQIVEDQELVSDNTCFVEVGAGKGHLSYYAWCSWCQNSSSSTLLVERAAMRHKRDNSLPATTTPTSRRLRADLADLILNDAPFVDQADALVALAKHLCGVATDYALRCVCAAEKSRGIVLATCCHHRCELPTYVGAKYLVDLGFTLEDLNVLFGVVSWATCGDGRARDSRLPVNLEQDNHTELEYNANDDGGLTDTHQHRFVKHIVDIKARESIGRKAKLLLDFGRVLYLRDKGFQASICYYVDSKVSLENVCIVAKK